MASQVIQMEYLSLWQLRRECTHSDEREHMETLGQHSEADMMKQNNHALASPVSFQHIPPSYLMKLSESA